MIVASASGYDSEHVITGVAGRKGFSVITIEKDMMNAEVGFGRKVLEIFEENDISFEHLPSGIDTMPPLSLKADANAFCRRSTAACVRTASSLKTVLP